jgi:hypothetical protein
VDAAALPGGTDEYLGDRLFEAEVRVRGDQADAAEAAADQLTQEGPPELQVLGRTHVQAEHLAFPAAPDAGRDEHRHRDHAPVLPDLLEGGIQHQVGVLAVEGPAPKGVDLGVQLLADPAHLVLRDALDAERLGKGVDVAGAEAVDVGLLDHREQRLLMTPAGFQQAWEVAARPQLGDVELDGADAGVPLPLPVAVAVGQPGLRAFVGAGADQLGHLGVHQLLRQQLQAVAQKLGVRTLLRLAQQVQQCHPRVGHRRGPPSG